MSQQQLTQAQIAIANELEIEMMQDLYTRYKKIFMTSKYCFSKIFFKF